jgi:hypothetical protein
MAEETPGFVSWFMVASVFIAADRSAPAADALVQAIAHPVLEQPEVEDDHVLSAYPWQAVSWAYADVRPKLVLEVCDRWEALEVTQGYTEQSYHAFRAAALLSLGRAEEARPHLLKAIEARRKQATWADQLTGLEQAVERKDRNYRWPGGRAWRPVDVFIKYR